MPNNNTNNPNNNNANNMNNNANNVNNNNANNNNANNNERTFNVVLNDEEQYSIWPADRSIPNGWHAEGTSGSKQNCLDHIENVWTDMRPLSVRRQLAGAH